MWVMTTGGFVSAVQEAGDADSVSVRARDRDSLQTVVDGIELVAGAEAPTIRTGEGTDYPYRITVTKTAFAQWLAFEAENYITYTNYKNAVTGTRGQKWHDALLNVWTAMFQVTDEAGKDHGYYASAFFGGKRSSTYRKKTSKKTSAGAGSGRVVSR